MLKVLKKVSKFFILLFLIIFGCIGILIATIQLPPVQLFVVKKVTSYLNEKLPYPIDLKGINIGWLGQIVLKDVLIIDKNKVEMLRISELEVKFNIPSLLTKNKTISSAKLVRPIIKLAFDPKIKDINIGDFIFCLEHMNDVPGTPPPPPHNPKIKRAEFKIKKIIIENAYCEFNDPEVVKLTDRFQFPHFAFDSIYLDVSNFKVIKDTFRFKINQLNAVDQFAKLRIKNLKADYSMCMNFLKFEGLEGMLGKSYMSDTVILKYNKYASLAHFNDSVKIKMNFKNANLYASDIGVFVPSIKDFGDTWQINGQFVGKVKNFRVHDLQVGFGKTSYINMSGRVKGFPNTDSTYSDLKIYKSLLFSKDIERYGLTDAAPILRKFHRAKVKGFYRGINSDFETFGEFDTPIGNFDINLEMKTPQKNLPNGKYFAEITTKNLDMGEALSNKTVGNISSHLFIKGSGFSKQNLDISMYGLVDKINFQHFDFKSIILNSTIKNEIIRANLDVKDSSLITDATFEMGLKNKEEHSFLAARIQKINLKSFGLTEDSVLLSSDVKLKTKGWGWGNLAGELDMNEISIKHKNKSVSYKIATANYKRVGENSDFEIKSDAADVQIVGLFNFQNLADHFIHFKNQMLKSWKNESFAVSNLYKIPENLPGGIDIKFDIKNKNINPLLQIFNDDWRFSPKLIAKGSYFSGHNHDLKLEAQADSIGFKYISLKENIIKLNILKSKNTSTLISDVLFESENQQVSDVISFEKLRSNTSWINHSINFNTSIKQKNETNEASINGEISILDNKKNINFYNSFVKLLDKDWKIDSLNQIMFSPNEITFKNTQFNNENQRIALEGSFSKSIDKSAKVIVDNFNLQNFNKLLGISLFGNVNSVINLRNIYKEPDIKSLITIDNLKIKKFDIGKVEGATNWDIINSKLLMDVAISKSGEKFFDLSGEYAPKVLENDKKLQLLAKFNHTHLYVLEPFVGQIISEIKGTATGDILISGNLSKPITNGKLQISDAGFKVNYLNTYYTFSDVLDIKPTKFEIRNAKMFDSESNIANVSVGFNHQNFQDLNMKINGHFNNILLLNTSFTDSCVYFGKAYATGNFDIKGTLKELNFDINAISEKETHIQVPLNNGMTVSKNEFITFTKKAKPIEKQNFKIKSKNTDLIMAMDFNFEFTPDAQLDIILDPVSQDKITGHGNGKINMKINTNDDFSMTGNYVFEKESYYNFTFLNTLDKQFNIKKGSKIMFTGNPYESLIDVTASYDDNVPIFPIITDTSAWRKSGIKAPYPVSTILMLKNDLMKPTITYDILIKDYPAVVSGVPLFNFVSAFENKIRNNENEMNNQVFGLLVFRRFMSTENIGIGNAVSGTVSELLSNQLSNFVSQLDENLQVDLNVNGLNRDALSAMQLRVSYTLLDGKIRVTRSSGVTNANNQSATANAIGEWMVEYMLTDDGKFRLKGFNKNNPNVLASGANNGSNTSAGASVVHTATFNSLNPFKKKKKKKIN